MKNKTCVAPEGGFRYGVHRPHFGVSNFRKRDRIQSLGETRDGRVQSNRSNFPPEAVAASNADWIYEIPNPFPFRGTTYIGKSWADAKSKDIDAIRLPPPPEVSLSNVIRQWDRGGKRSFHAVSAVLADLPQPLLLALAAVSTDPEDLVSLARRSCDFLHDDAGAAPTGLACTEDDRGRLQPLVHDPLLFEAVANNPALPDVYKEVMALRPGVQGNSEITGDWESRDGRTRVYEYLRRNSYIPWGHYAANMAEDAVRYAASDLTTLDMKGLRHLYYQRTFVRVAESLGLAAGCSRRAMTGDELEALRVRITDALQERGPDAPMPFNRTLWGWNFGFDFAPSRYRLHASHQQVHQQYAMIPATIPSGDDSHPDFSPYGCGDMVEDFVHAYRERTGSDFFSDYVQSIRSNRRFTGSAGTGDGLVVYEDAHVLLFVPKAQTSQWELQLMALGSTGNILEADTARRNALDRGLLVGQRLLACLGARMVTTIEFSKRFDAGDNGQRLLYSLLPRLPESPGAFSEAQLRWINGHYPEDFACACRLRLPEVKELLPDIPMRAEGPASPPVI